VLRPCEVNIKHMNTSKMKADGLTKGLDKIKHEWFINDMKLRKVEIYIELYRVLGGVLE
jgi:hypothetical protein